LSAIRLQVTGTRSVTATMGAGWLAGVWNHLAGEALDSQITPLDTAHIDQIGPRTHRIVW
jgi:hypothetical protein